MKLLYHQPTQQVVGFNRLDNEIPAGLDPDYLVLDEVFTTPPEYNSATHQLSSNYEVDLENLEYRQEWTVTEKPEQPDWDGFNAQLITDPAYHQAVANVRASIMPGLDTPVVVALGQVDTKGIASFALAFPPFCQMGQVSAEQREAWAVIAKGCNLPADFIAIVRGT